VVYGAAVGQSRPHAYTSAETHTHTRTRTFEKLSFTSAALTSAILLSIQIGVPSNSLARAIGHLLLSSAYSRGGSAAWGRLKGNSCSACAGLLAAAMVTRRRGDGVADAAGSQAPCISLERVKEQTESAIYCRGYGKGLSRICVSSMRTDSGRSESDVCLAMFDWSTY